MRSLIAFQSRLLLIKSPCVMTSREPGTVLWYTPRHMAAKTCPFMAEHMDDTTHSTNSTVQVIVTTFTGMIYRCVIQNMEGKSVDSDCIVQRVPSEQHFECST